MIMGSGKWDVSNISFLSFRVIDLRKLGGWKKSSLKTISPNAGAKW